MTAVAAAASASDDRRRTTQPEVEIRSGSGVMAHWHEYNPWADRLVYVTVEELAACVAGGEILDSMTGKVSAYDVEHVLREFRQYGDLLDAYILPNSGSPSGYSLGLRYGMNGRDYLSPGPGNLAALKATLERRTRDSLEVPPSRPAP
jgi:hypothetical protein